MKISKIAIMASAVTLAITSFYGTMVPKKLAQAPSGYALAPYNRTVFILGTGGFSSLTTVKVSGGITYKTAQFKTINGGAAKLVTQQNKTRTLYFRP